MKRTIMLSIALLLTTVPSFALTNNLSAVADTSISARDPDNNSGGHTHAFAGRDAQSNNRRALYLFDLSTIPSGSTINSATLKLVVVMQPNGGIGSNFQLHTMTAEWFEGTKTGNNGSAATAGESTWNNRIHNTTAWSTSAGAVGDFTVSASASAPVTGLGSFSWSSAQLNTDVQIWVDNPGLNFGWIIISDNETNIKTAKGFGTRNNTTPANRPELVLTFTPPLPQEDIVIQNLSVSSSTLILQWSGPTNLLYDVQYRPSLTSVSGWETAESNIVSSVSGINFWIDPVPLISPSNAFFRIQGQ